MLLRALSIALWLAVAASGLAWAWTLRGAGAPATPKAQLAAPALAAGATDWVPVLGARAPAPPAAAPIAAAPTSPLRLLGVVASGANGQGGFALIAAAEGLPRVFRVGAVVDGDTVVQSVAARQVRLGPRGGAANAVLELAPPAPLAGGSIVPARARAPVRSAEAANDASPIVPPYTDMVAPTAAESSTPGSPWSRLREAAAQGEAASPAGPAPR